MRISIEVKEGKLKQGNILEIARLLLKVEKEEIVVKTKNSLFNILKNLAKENGFFLSINLIRNIVLDLEKAEMINLKEHLFLGSTFFELEIDKIKLKEVIDKTNFEGGKNE